MPTCSFQVGYIHQSDQNEVVVNDPLGLGTGLPGLLICILYECLVPKISRQLVSNAAVSSETVNANSVCFVDLNKNDQNGS